MLFKMAIIFYCNFSLFADEAFPGGDLLLPPPSFAPKPSGSTAGPFVPAKPSFNESALINKPTSSLEMPQKQDYFPSTTSTNSPSSNQLNTNFPPIATEKFPTTEPPKSFVSSTEPLPKNILNFDKSEGPSMDENFAKDVSGFWNKINMAAENFKKKATTLDSDFKKNDSKISAFTKEIDPKIESLQEFYDDIKNYFSAQKSIEAGSDFKQKISMLDFSLREFSQSLSKLDQTLSDLNFNFSELSELIKKKNILMPGLLSIENEASAIKTESINFKKKSDDEKKAKRGQLEGFVVKTDKFVSDLQDIETTLKAKSDNVENKITAVKGVLDDLINKEKQIEADVKIISQLKQKDSTASEISLLKKISEEKKLKQYEKTDLDQLNDLKKEVDASPEEASELIHANISKIPTTKINRWNYWFWQLMDTMSSVAKKTIPFLKKVWNAICLIDNSPRTPAVDLQKTSIPPASVMTQPLSNMPQIKPMPQMPQLNQLQPLQPITSNNLPQINKLEPLPVFKIEENNLEPKSENSNNFFDEIKASFYDIFNGFIRFFKSTFNYLKEVYSRI